MIDVEPTAQIIDQAAEQLIKAAEELIRVSSRMRDTKDLSYASEALMVIMNSAQNARVDLLITRPIRALSLALNTGQRISHDSK